MTPPTGRDVWPDRPPAPGLLPGDGPPARRHCTICADADWLSLSGEVLESIAGRLHVQPDSLLTHLKRHERDDLYARLLRQRLADIRPSTYR